MTSNKQVVHELNTILAAMEAVHALLLETPGTQEIAIELQKLAIEKVQKLIEQLDKTTAPTQSKNSHSLRILP